MANRGRPTLGALLRPRSRLVRFEDRADAGRQLAALLHHLAVAQPVVIGLPRGGVPVAAEVARHLRAPLDVVVVRKLGLPYQPELAMGAIGERGTRVLNDGLIRAAGISAEQIAAVESRERVELERRAPRFRSSREPVSLTGRTVIVVDDGIATGATARAALKVVRALGAARVVLAAPVAAPDVVAEFLAEGIADEVVTVETPEDLMAVGYWYRDFAQTSDDTVVELLAAARMNGAPQATATDQGRDDEVRLDLDGLQLEGHLTVPPAARGVVLFAHGSGSSRHSPRNRSVAAALNRAGLATLLFDLLSPHEGADRALVFDIELLARRLTVATRWLAGEPDVATLGVGYFGASTGAAAALWAAAEPGSPVTAVVSRGGRPDLAGLRLADVRAPTLFIVGGDDTTVLDLNRQAATHLTCEHRIDVIAGATHLFEESGALEAVARQAREWFLRWLPVAV